MAEVEENACTPTNASDPYHLEIDVDGTRVCGTIIGLHPRQIYVRLDSPIRGATPASLHIPLLGMSIPADRFFTVGKTREEWRPSPRGRIAAEGLLRKTYLVMQVVESRSDELQAMEDQARAKTMAAVGDHVFRPEFGEERRRLRSAWREGEMDYRTYEAARHRLSARLRAGEELEDAGWIEMAQRLNGTLPRGIRPSEVIDQWRARRTEALVR